ncbi:hypothetical protein F5Y00DRAFT_261371 [Daldinia vernicosa]|uniref:uncharacterized protein n=1 Tax=Daldinia vernicosa TaxID=114800 RepID=UPI002007EAA8|nr:uncharacterized protein F5Y00DRAFT_261371 [Daldinia vernicosa]KAI0849586.1 hypothetical protein F5Y00DRAFT_261371 [Daldinia vernicosa]
MSHTFQRMRSSFSRTTQSEKRENSDTSPSQGARKQTYYRNRRPFEILYNGPTGATAGEIEVDIIAVHGLGSNVDWSWTWKGEDGKPPYVHWLKDPDMLPAVVPNARIMTYCYESRWHSNAPKIRLEICGEELIHSLHYFRTGVLDRPLIFIAHSLGGLVVLYGLLYADRDRRYGYIPERTIGFAALGTPFGGTKMQSIAAMSAWLMSFAGSNNGIIADLSLHNKYLEEKVHAFGQLRERLKLPIWCFIELKDTDYGKRFGIPGLIRGRVVSETSAHVPGWKRSNLYSDHLKLNKFSGPDDRSFLTVSGEIYNMYNDWKNSLDKRKSGDTVKPALPTPESFDVEKTHSDSFEHKAASFIDRSGLLHRMTDEIGTTPHFRSILGLYGIAGCGKSVMARHFARSKDFTARFELPGKSEIDFNATLARFAEDIPGLVPPLDSVNLTRDLLATGESNELRDRQQKSIDAIIQWFNAKGNTKWFILIDDIYFRDLSKTVIGESKHWVQYFIDKIHQGTIIATSQSPDLARIFPSIHVDGLEDFESLRLIEKVLGLREGSGGNSYLKLAKLLDNHALSVYSAARYMKQYIMDVEDYINIWRSQDESILDDSRLRLDQTLTKTISLAIERLESETRGFLLVCAFLDPGCIWAELFPDIPHDKFKHFVWQLGALSLIKQAPNLEFGKGGIAIHPAVHKVVRLLALQRSDVESYINSAIYSVARALPNEDSKEAAEEQRWILPHVMQCKENLEILKSYGLNIRRGILPGLGRLGQLLQRRGQLDDAARIYAWALRTYDELSLMDHLENEEINGTASANSQTQEMNNLPCQDADYYIILNDFGIIYKDRNEFEHAEACFKFICDSIDSTSVKAHLGDSSNFILDINLALVLTQRGRLDEAETLLNRAKGHYKTLPEKYARVQELQIEQYLGTILKLRGDLVGASEALSEASSRLQAILGSSLESALAEKELGSVFLLQGKPESLNQARKCFKEAEKYIGEHCEADSIIALDLRWHQVTLRMAQCYKYKQDDETAVQQACDDYEKHIQRLEELLPRNDAMTLNSIRTYGKWLIKLGRFHGGRRKLQRAIKGYKLQTNNPLQAAFANMDLADGYFTCWPEEQDDLHNLEMAKEYYLKSVELFVSLNSSFANVFTVDIHKKLYEIRQRLDTA